MRLHGRPAQVHAVDLLVHDVGNLRHRGHCRRLRRSSRRTRSSGTTWASGHHILWLIGIIAAGMTSFYMFRLWFLTFFGEYRGPNPATAGHGHDADTQHAGHTGAVHDAEDKHAAGGGHGHGTPHESPWVMVVPLIILAVLSLVGGWIGVPARAGRLRSLRAFPRSRIRRSTRRARRTLGNRCR